MSEAAVSSVKPNAPWHIWVVGILTLLWDGAGAYTIMMAQAARLPGLTPDEIAYYAKQSLWFVIVTDFALVTAIAAGVALLLRSRHAVGLFAISLIAILQTNAWDLGAETSRALASRGALIATCVIVVLAGLQLWYAMATKKRAVLT